MRKAKPKAEWDWADHAATRLVRGYRIHQAKGLELRDRIAAALRKAAAGGRDEKDDGSWSTATLQ